MKLRTSFCNGTALKKDITRFAPLWAVYLVGGLLVMMTLLPNYSSMEAARALTQCLGPFSVINMIYAAVCAQLLLGDLFQSRMCNALHAMPLKRECWFCTHVIAGLLFSLVPHLIGLLCMSLVLRQAAFIGLIWVLGMALEYLFFFGLAVFSVFCVGNRVAQLAIYGILNFGSMIIYWFVDTFYVPLLYGMQLPTEPFIQFCPVANLSEQYQFVLFERVPVGYNFDWQYAGFGPGWGYLTLCGAVGLVLLGLALLLYRRRKLEMAGNFIAVRPLEPVFAVVFTLCVGAVFAVVGQLFGESYMVYLVVGLVLGWFVGQMLLKRTVRVFHWKTFLKLGIFGLIMGASLLITSMDPLGITRWVPKQEDVAYVQVCTGSYIRTTSDMYLKLEEAEDIETIRKAHEAAAAWGEPAASTGVRRQSFVICYTLKSGQQVYRYYTVCSDMRAWNYLSSLYNSPEDIMGYTDWESFAASVTVAIEGNDFQGLCDKYTEKTGIKVEYQTIQRELLEALKADCEAGTLTKDIFSVTKGNYEFAVEWYVTKNSWRYLAVCSSHANTMQWYETYKDIVEMNVTK